MSRSLKMKSISHLPFYKLMAIYQLFLLEEVVKNHVYQVTEVGWLLRQRIVQEVADELELVD